MNYRMREEATRGIISCFLGGKGRGRSVSGTGRERDTGEERRWRKKNVGDRIIEATMKQGLPAWMGMDGGLPFASVQSKTPAFSRERKGKAETVRFVMRRERKRELVPCCCFRMLKYDGRSTVSWKSGGRRRTSKGEN